MSSEFLTFAKLPVICFLLLIRIAACDPSPSLVTFDDICTQYAQKVQIEGILHLPDQITRTSGGNPDWCTAHLLDLDREGYMVIGLNIEAHEYNPRNNFMADLPTSYMMADFKVRADDGNLIGEGDLVRITGNVTSPLLGPASGQEMNCSLGNITKVERITALSLPGAEKSTRADFSTAIAKGWATATIRGDGLSKIDLSLKSNTDFSTEISIEPGTVFVAQSAGVQNMVVRQGTIVVLKPSADISLELEVSCANMALKEPSAKDAFIVSPGAAPDDLLKLVNLSEFRFENQRIQQFSIWTIFDNPAKPDYAEIIDEYHVGGPTDEEVKKIRALFLSAGIDISNYQVFGM